VKRDFLEEALAGFEGCVVMVSHDRYFLNATCTAIVSVENHTLQRYEGDYDAYRARRPPRSPAKTSSAAPVVKKAPERDVSAKRGAGDDSKGSGEGSQKPLTYNERQRLTEIETEVETMEAKKAAIEAQLSDPSFYARRSSEIGPLNRELQSLGEEIQTLWQEWSALEDRR